MMNYLRSFKRINEQSKILSKSTEWPRSYFIYDYFCALVFHGCSIGHYFSGGFWKLKSIQRKDVFTYRRLNKIIIAKYNNRDYIYLLKEKNKFNEYFKNFVKRDWFYCGDSNIEAFKTFLLRHEEVIIKPLDDYEGRGIRKSTSKELLDDADKYYNEFKSNRFIIEEIVKNHPDISFGDGKSLNTIRIYSFMDKQGEPHLLKAILRCGTGDHIVDNFHSGGVGYEVDLNTGVVISTGRSWDKSNIVTHPGTNIVIVGRHLPEWESVIENCIAAAKLIPQCKYVAWDIAVTNHGVEFIEGNHDGDCDLLEYFGSMGYWKIIKKYI